MEARKRRGRRARHVSTARPEHRLPAGHGVPGVRGRRPGRAAHRRTTRSPSTRACGSARGSTGPFRFLPGNPFGVNPTLSSINLQATLVEFTPLVLTGLAVAFAYRCGLFNIGGQGQFWVGAFTRVHRGPAGRRLYRGDPRDDRRVASGAPSGQGSPGPEGLPRRSRGDHDDHAQLDRHLRWGVVVRAHRALAGQGFRRGAVSETLGGRPAVPGCSGGRSRAAHIGDLHRARGRAFLFWLILSRTTLGYEVRAVGLNPDAARYGGVGGVGAR